MPSLAELCEVYKNRAVINESLAKIYELGSDYADSSLGDYSSYYWSSSQSSDSNYYAWSVNFSVGFVGYNYKGTHLRVCCIAGF